LINKNKKQTKKKKNQYFGKEEEDAVVEYLQEKDQQKRDEIYREKLKEPFNVMIKGILDRYPIHLGNFSTTELSKMALAHLIENFTNFDPWKPDKMSVKISDIILSSIKEQEIDEMEIKFYIYDHKLYNVDKLPVDFEKHFEKFITTNLCFYEQKNLVLLSDGTYTVKLYVQNDKLKMIAHDKEIFIPIKTKRKAYSYCGTIVRNYLKTHSESTYNRKIKFVELEPKHYKNYGTYDILNNENKEEHFKKYFGYIIDKFQHELELNDFLTDEQIIVAETIIDILENWEVLFLDKENNESISHTMTKNKFWLYMRENTRLEKKEIKQAMKRFISLYEELALLMRNMDFEL